MDQQLKLTSNFWTIICKRISILNISINLGVNKENMEDIYVDGHLIRIPKTALNISWMGYVKNG